MEDKILHSTNDFLKLKPLDILKSIIEDDKANYNKAESELGKEIQLLDNAIALYIELLQAAHRHKDEWQDKASLQAAIAMAVSTLNYVLFARHGILLGYYPEARDLLRGCHERITRCYLFFADEAEAESFLSGRKIWQKDVRKKLARILAEEKEEQQQIREYLKEYYGEMSEDVHPNLASLKARALVPELKTSIALALVIGGFLSHRLGQTVIVVLLQSLITALHILSAVVSEQTGKWNKDYERIKADSNKLLKQLKESTTTYTQPNASK